MGFPAPWIFPTPSARVGSHAGPAEIPPNLPLAGVQHPSCTPQAQGGVELGGLLLSICSSINYNYFGVFPRWGRASNTGWGRRYGPRNPKVHPECWSRSRFLVCGPGSSPFNGAVRQAREQQLGVVTRAGREPAP